MSFSRPDTFWATVRLRVEETSSRSHRAVTVRGRGFEAEVDVERPWTRDGGAALIRMRLASNNQLDPSDSLLITQQVRPTEYPYIDALEVEHLDDRTIQLIAWPLPIEEGGGGGDIPSGRTVLPPCAFEADILVMRVHG